MIGDLNDRFGSMRVEIMETSYGAEVALSRLRGADEKNKEAYRLLSQAGALLMDALGLQRAAREGLGETYEKAKNFPAQIEGLYARSVQQERFVARAGVYVQGLGNIYDKVEEIGTNSASLAELVKHLHHGLHEQGEAMIAVEGAVGPFVQESKRFTMTIRDC